MCKLKRAATLYRVFLFLLLFSVLLPACGKKGADMPGSEDGSPAGNVVGFEDGDSTGNVESSGNNSSSKNEASPSTGSEKTTPSVGETGTNGETQENQPVISDDYRGAKDMPFQEQEVGRKGGEMLPVELIDPAEYENFEKEFQDYTPGYDACRSNLNEYALDGTILYVKSMDFGDPLIYCLDLENGDCYPLCSKPECFHDSWTCNAFAESSAYDRNLSVYMGIAYLNIYQGKLIAYDTKSVFYRRLDGTGGEDIGTLYPNLAGGESVYGFFPRDIRTHRGYVYSAQNYRTKNGFGVRFLRIPVSGGEMEVVWEYTYSRESDERYDVTEEIIERYNKIGIVNYYGLADKVYFAVSDENREDGKGITSLYCYDTKKDEVFLYWEFTGKRILYPANGKWYSFVNEAVYSWDPKTDEEHCLYRFADNPLAAYTLVNYYGDGFLVTENTEDLRPKSTREILEAPDWTNWCLFYDWDGNLVAKIKPPFADKTIGDRIIKGCFDGYVVCSIECKGAEGYEYYAAVLDTSRLGDPSLEWMIFRLAAD